MKSAAQGQLGPDFHQRDEDNIDVSREPTAASTIEALIQEAALAGYANNDVSPHEFKPLKRWRNRGRCARCLAHEELHPAFGYLPSRPLFDNREAIRV